MGNKRPLHQRATMMFKKYDENIPDIDIVSHLHSVEKKLLDLVGEFDSDKLKSGAKPEQKLSPIKTGGYFGFQNILVYGVEVAAPIDVCFKTFYTGVFHTDGTAKNGTCPFYSGSTEPLPSDGVHFPKLETPNSSHFIYHWTLAAPSLQKSGEIRSGLDTYLRLRIACYDEKLNKLEWSPESRQKCAYIVYGACSVDSTESHVDDTTIAHNSGTQRIEFDFYGYVFKKLDGTRTKVYHMNHIAKGIKLNVVQSVTNTMLRKTRNKQACERELERFKKFSDKAIYNYSNGII